MNLSDFVDKLIKLDEKRGVPEHPKAAAEKKKKTFISRYGKEAFDKKEKIAKGLKKHKADVDNPYAVGTAWALHPEQVKSKIQKSFTPAERKAAGKKAAKTKMKTTTAAERSKWAKKAAASRAKKD